ncbi:phosphatase PAP2 family protein [Caulobacter sp. NIBR2454]|uniref:phosphatase PAP2 family protein n=1 Tax=Caulobacter sp. NIBR2454 TaxID=3015996 RepID=UPI0022B72A7B|nr:phosphatase PAP2 family protein [Caulobacter sp. NIBR2454]
MSPPQARTPHPARMTAIGAPLSATASVAVLGVLVWRAHGGPLHWDEPGREALVTLLGATPLLAAWAGLGDVRLLALVCAAFTLVAMPARRLRQATILWGAAAASLASSLILKALIDRPRPPGAFEAGASFPSTHSAMAAAVWLTLAMAASARSTRLRVAIMAAALAAAVLSALAGVALGRHWPSDAAAGLALGVVVACLAARRMRGLGARA